MTERMMDRQTREVNIIRVTKAERSGTNKKLSYYWETVRRESMLRIAEMDVEMTT